MTKPELLSILAMILYASPTGPVSVAKAVEEAKDLYDEVIAKL